MSNVSKTNRFIFTIGGFRELSYRVQSASIGSINLGSTPFPTSVLDMSVPSNKIDFSPMAIRILLSENFDEWMEVLKWTFDFTKHNASHLDTVQSGTLTILNANNVAIMAITYMGLAPITIGEIDFDLTSDEVTSTFDLTMTYDSYSVKNLITGEEIVYSK